MPLLPSPAPSIGLALLVQLALSAAASAQFVDRSAPPEPASFAFELAGDLPQHVLPAPDVEALLLEDEARGPFPLRYGALLPAALDLDRHGRWDETADAFLWRLELASPGAYSLGILLAEFRLPAQAALYVYSPDRARLLGPFTRVDEQPDGMLAIAPLAGDRLVLELVLAKTVAASPRLALESVVHDYRDVFDLALAQEPVREERAGCLVDVNCPQGAPYQDVKRSVVGLLRGGFVCSGSILNNTAEDGTPYMLTAHHCGGMTNAVIVFGYERTGCGGGASSIAQSVSGATLLAVSDTYDSQLYLLNQAPPAAYRPFYAGWDRGASPPAPAVSISHPSGLPKKLALDNQGPANWGTQWGATWNQGTLEGGSSGSPLFHGGKRVIGPACCVSNFTCGLQTAFYGQFHKFWNSQSLATWLDPLGTGAQGIDGHGPFDPAAETYVGGGTNPVIYSSTLPVLGVSWTGTIDTSGFPAATSTVIVGSAAPASGSLFPFGELLLDLSGPLLFKSNAGVVGTSSTHVAALPNDPLLAGTVAYTQAVVLDGGVRATNGIALTLNF